MQSTYLKRYEEILTLLYENGPGYAMLDEELTVNNINAVHRKTAKGIAALKSLQAVIIQRKNELNLKL